jgi:hypothetical protein
MRVYKKFFLIPTVVTLLSLSLVFYYNSLAGMLSVLILIILEVTLSFDNAVVNAKVLEQMDEKWRRRFINWGIWIAVFGTRIVLPIIIVSLVSGINIIEVLNLAIYYSPEYAAELDKAHYSIAAFGGSFLMLVALAYFVDERKDIDWLERIEKFLKKFGQIQSFEIAFVMTFLIGISMYLPEHAQDILMAGSIGIILFILMQGLTSTLGKGVGEAGGKVVVASGLYLFLYLNVLDSAFSLDGVIGAFAISTNLLIIAVGLGVGAYFVRTFTLYMVEQKTLQHLKYLEHGAHWAILGLGACMLLDLIFHIPELVIGTIGLAFVAWSYYSSCKK